MSRRDTILVAVLINAGLLALLFMIAINPDEERVFESFAQAPALVESAASKEKIELEPVIHYAKSAVEDEIDKALFDFTDKVAYDPPKSVEIKKAEETKDPHITITVKRGDMLERIARANGTTVQKLKQLNHLQDERLEVGQVLRVPAGYPKEEVAQEANKKTPILESEEFYTIKNGDNPWKIAKQFNVRFDELLNLNNLDEEKARKLKAGDKIRVH